MINIFDVRIHISSRTVNDAPVMSADLQAALGAIQVLKDKKQKLETGKLEMKLVLGDIKFEEKVTA